MLLELPRPWQKRWTQHLLVPNSVIQQDAAVLLSLSREGPASHSQELDSHRSGKSPRAAPGPERAVSPRSIFCLLPRISPSPRLCVGTPVSGCAPEGTRSSVFSFILKQWEAMDGV